MRRYVFQRIILIFFTAFIIIFLFFVIIKQLPDYEQSVIGIDPELKALIEEREGYGKPVLEQFWIWLSNIFNGEGLGYSLKKSRDVWQILKEKIPVSMRLNIIPYLLGIPIGIGLGVWAALKKNKLTDHIISIGIIFFISVPSFVIGTMLQYYVVYVWEWIGTPYVYASVDWPGDFWGGVSSYILPIFVLLVGNVAGLARTSRAELTEVLTSEFMLLCRTKGLTKGQATVRHGLRNAMVPIAPALLGGFIFIIAGSLITERIFRVPGVGKVYLEAFQNQDYPLIMGYLMFYELVALFAILIVDLSYGVIDPRIRMGGGRR